MWNVAIACRMLLLHATRLAFSLALASTGRSIAARIAMIAITTSNSINVKPEFRPRDMTVELVSTSITSHKFQSKGFSPLVRGTVIEPGARTLVRSNFRQHHGVGEFASPVSNRAWLRTKSPGSGGAKHALILPPA